jgi:hypothetical protein
MDPPACSCPAASLRGGTLSSFGSETRRVRGNSAKIGLVRSGDGLLLIILDGGLSHPPLLKAEAFGLDEETASAADSMPEKAGSRS